MKTIGQKIKCLRNAVGLSQKELSRKINVDERSISRYETGKSIPDCYTLVRISTFFNVSADYILGLTSYEKEIEIEKYRIKEDGSYNILYKRYLDCLNHYEVYDQDIYYWISLDKNEITGQTQWVGFSDEESKIEIRKLRPIHPENVIKLCKKLRIKPIVINEEKDIPIFIVYGGQAIIKSDLCEKYLSEYMYFYFKDGELLRD